MTDAKEALEVARARDFDAVLSDIYLKGMSGLELCTSLTAEAQSEAGTTSFILRLPHLHKPTES